MPINTGLCIPPSITVWLLLGYLVLKTTSYLCAVPKGCLTRDGMLHMMFKLGQCAQKNWRRLRGFDDLAKVITGVKFNDGIEVTNVDQAAA